MRNNEQISDGVLLTVEDQLDGDSAEELSSFIDDMNAEQGAETYITVLRIPTDSRGTPQPNSKHMGQLFHELLGRSTVNDVIERIRRDFIRPGETSICVRILGKKPGEKRLLFNRIYTIEKAETPNKGPEGSVAEMLRLMQANADAQATRTENFMREMLSMQASARIQPAESIVDQLVKLSPLLTPLITGLLGRPLPPAGGGATELLATVRTLKEASNLFGGGRDDGDSTMSTVKAVAEAVVPGLKFLATRAETERMTAAERLRRLPAPAAPVAPPKVTPKAAPAARKNPPTRPQVAPAPNNNAEGEDVNLKETRERLEMLATLCDEGQTAEAVAELVIDNIEDDQLEELYNRVQPENFVRKMAVLAPAAIKGRELWFEELRKEILAQYEEDPDGADDVDALPAEGSQVNGTGGETVDELGADPVDLGAIPDAKH